MLSLNVAAWGSPGNTSLGDFPVIEGRNFIVVAADAGKLPLVNGFLVRDVGACPYFSIASSSFPKAGSCASRER